MKEGRTLENTMTGKAFGGGIPVARDEQFKALNEKFDLASHTRALAHPSTRAHTRQGRGGSQLLVRASSQELMSRSTP